MYKQSGTSARSQWTKLVWCGASPHTTHTISCRSACTFTAQSASTEPQPVNCKWATFGRALNDFLAKEMKYTKTERAERARGREKSIAPSFAIIIAVPRRVQQAQVLWDLVWKCYCKLLVFLVFRFHSVEVLADDRSTGRSDLSLCWKRKTHCARSTSQPIWGRLPANSMYHLGKHTEIHSQSKYSSGGD